METPDFIPPIGPGCRPKSSRLQSVVGNAGEGLKEADQGH